MQFKIYLKTYKSVNHIYKNVLKIINKADKTESF